MQQSTLFEKECEAEEITASIVEKKWKFICKRQVSVYGKIPDIIAYDKNSDTLIAVEVKLKDWKKCLYQAFLNRNIVDFSFLCMPKNFYKDIKNKIRNDLNKTGLGFLEIDPFDKDILIKRTPGKNYVNTTRREHLKKIVCDGESLHR